MYRVRVFVTLKESILDPAGAAVETALQGLGFADVGGVRIGKMIELTIEKGEDVDALIQSMCEKLLVNTVMEAYRYEIEEIGS